MIARGRTGLTARGRTGLTARGRTGLTARCAYTIIALVALASPCTRRAPGVHRHACVSASMLARSRGRPLARFIAMRSSSPTMANSVPPSSTSDARACIGAAYFGFERNECLGERLPVAPFHRDHHVEIHRCSVVAGCLYRHSADHEITHVVPVERFEDRRDVEVRHDADGPPCLAIPAIWAANAFHENARWSRCAIGMARARRISSMSRSLLPRGRGAAQAGGPSRTEVGRACHSLAMIRLVRAC